MRVFVTGATGFIGSAVVPELLGAGHQVVGLARSDASAAALAAAGAEVHRGDLDDLDSLRAGAAAADGVIHLAFIHDFAGLRRRRPHRPARRRDARRRARGLRPAVRRHLRDRSGSPPGRVGDRGRRGRPRARRLHRGPSERRRSRSPTRGVRSSSCGSPPSVHGEGDHGFVPTLIDIAREQGRLRLRRRRRQPLAGRAPARRRARSSGSRSRRRRPGSVLHGVADEGVPTRDIAEVDRPPARRAGGLGRPGGGRRALRLARRLLRASTSRRRAR